jgi:predicted methyltransferase MtxX (methanogen marker protein 4)
MGNHQNQGQNWQNRNGNQGQQGPKLDQNRPEINVVNRESAEKCVVSRVPEDKIQAEIRAKMAAGYRLSHLSRADGGMWVCVFQLA